MLTYLFNTDLAFPFPLFAPSPLKVLFDLEGGNEVHGVMLCAFVV